MLSTPRALLLLLLLVAGCASRTRPEPAPMGAPPAPERFAGWYEAGWERSVFRPCGTREEWWVWSSERIIGDDSFGWGRVFVVLEGTVSPRGSYGHLGRYPRQIAVARVVEVQPADSASCRSAVRSADPRGAPASPRLAPLGAQDVEPPCTYATCALRVEPTFFGTRIVRGAAGEPVARLGLFGADPDLPEVVAGSERAVEHALVYERTTPRGALLLLSGTTLLVLPPFLEGSVSDDAVTAAVFTGLGLTFWGSFTLMDAQRALSRALWWYNGELAR